MSETNKLKYKHPWVNPSNFKTKQLLLDEGETDGLHWEWRVHSDLSPIGTSKMLKECVYFTWSFDWKELKKIGFVGFVGSITSYYFIGSEDVALASELELTECGQKVVRRVDRFEETKFIGGNSFGARSPTSKQKFAFGFSLTPIMAVEKIVKFPSSELTDVILVVEGVDVHVNKTFLSVHSEYFRTMFNADFREKSMVKIPIDDVKYKDFERLLAVIQPTCEFPKDDDLEMLLNLADRFMIPSVVHRAQYHLLTASQLPFSEMLKLADKYDMQKATSFLLSLITTADQFKNVKTSPMSEKSVMSFEIERQLARHPMCKLGETVLREGALHGLHWKWTFFTDIASVDSRNTFEHCVFMSWIFEWNEAEMRAKGIRGFVGTADGAYERVEALTNVVIPTRFDVQLTHSGQCIKKRIGTVEETQYKSDGGSRYLQTHFSLQSVGAHDADDDTGKESSEVSRFHDAVLLIEGKRIYVNKNYLSFRSEFFDKLFNSDFKEKSLTEIPIGGVKYEDFKQFLDVIHPLNPKTPKEEDVEMLLELADRFMMPAVTCHVEQFLMSNSSLQLSEVLKMTDKYKMDKLLEHNVNAATTREQIDLLIYLVKFTELSDSTRLKFLDRVMDNIRKLGSPI